ncbi:MAG: metal ABC transporter permease [Phycisphaerales bacterium]|nr:metal ABC transporter permease [Phycisphaerales bacterium]
MMEAALWLFDAVISGLLTAIGALPFEAVEAGFIRRALLTVLLVAPVCGMVGVYVVNFRMAFFSDAISHSAFAGVALGFLAVSAGLAWVDPRLTLVALAIVVGLLITAAKRRTELGTDTIIGVAFAGVMALGIAIIRFDPRFQRDFASFLYGDVLTVDQADLRIALLLAICVSVFMTIAYNRLLLVGLNLDLARTRGVATRAYDYLFAVLVVLVVTATIRISGLLLVTALLVVPAATARNLARSAGQVLWYAAGAGVLAGVGGLVVSIGYNIAASAAIILIGVALFGLSLGFRADWGRSAR